MPVASWFLSKYNEQNPVFECKDIKEFKENLEKRKYKTVKIGDVSDEIRMVCLASIQVLDQITGVFAVLVRRENPAAQVVIFDSLS